MTRPPDRPRCSTRASLSEHENASASLLARRMLQERTAWRDGTPRLEGWEFMACIMRHLVVGPGEARDGFQRLQHLQRLLGRLRAQRRQRRLHLARVRVRVRIALRRRNSAARVTQGLQSCGPSLTGQALCNPELWSLCMHVTGRPGGDLLGWLLSPQGRSLAT